MLRIFVVSQSGVIPSRPLFAEFGEGVGGIGRDEENVLTLPDPFKHISRVQAQIKCLSGEYFLVSQGSNPSHVNGRLLAKGGVASLHPGDRIEMADWVLGVERLEEKKPLVPVLHEADTQKQKTEKRDVVTVNSSSDVDEFDFNLPTQIVTIGPDQLLTENEKHRRTAIVKGLQVQPSGSLSAKESSDTPPEDPFPEPLFEQSFQAKELRRSLARGLGLAGTALNSPLEARQMERLGSLLREAVLSLLAIHRSVLSSAEILDLDEQNPFRELDNLDYLLARLLCMHEAEQGAALPDIFREVSEQILNHVSAESVSAHCGHDEVRAV